MSSESSFSLVETKIWTPFLLLLLFHFYQLARRFVLFLNRDFGLDLRACTSVRLYYITYTQCGPKQQRCDWRARAGSSLQAASVRCVACSSAILANHHNNHNYSSSSFFSPLSLFANIAYCASETFLFTNLYSIYIRFRSICIALSTVDIVMMYRNPDLDLDRR